MSGPQAGHVDSVFEKGGPFTKYQILIQISTTFLCLVTSYNNVLSLFTGLCFVLRDGSEFMGNFYFADKKGGDDKTRQCF